MSGGRLKRPCIVVAYDGSAPSRAAVRYAAARAGVTGKVIVVHCFGLPSEWFGAAVAEPVAVEHSQRGQAVLDDLMMTDGSVLAEVDFEVELIGGEPAKTVNHLAEVNDADEIVLGTRGAGRVASLLGSVAQDVIRHADRPVVVIPYDAVREPERSRRRNVKLAMQQAIAIPSSPRPPLAAPSAVDERLRRRARTTEFGDDSEDVREWT